MNATKPTRMLLQLTLCAGLLAMPALAADTDAEAEGADMAAMMEAMQAAAAPGEHHRFLAGLSGQWTFRSTMWMEPGSTTSMSSTGTASKSMIFGGRYLQEEVTGDFMGSTFHGRAITGYDNTAEAFVGTWFDDMSTGIATFEGSRDGNSVTMHGEYLDPMTRQSMKVRAVTQVVDGDHHVFTYYMTMPGAAEFKSMEIAYTRVGAQ